MKQTVTWVLVADAGRARILESRGPGKGLHQVPDTEMHQELPKDSEIFADRAGRSFDSRGGGRHRMEATSSPHRALKAEFAKALADRLAAAATAKSFGRLVLVAPPTLLGDLRKALPPAVASLVTAEIDKDLTHVATQDIASHLGDLRL